MANNLPTDKPQFQHYYNGGQCYFRQMFRKKITHSCYLLENYRAGAAISVGAYFSFRFCPANMYTAPLAVAVARNLPSMHLFVLLLPFAHTNPAAAAFVGVRFYSRPRNESLLTKASRVIFPRRISVCALPVSTREEEKVICIYINSVYKYIYIHFVAF